MYPVTDYNFESESYKQYGCGYSLTTKAMQFFWSSYVDGVDADPTSDELLSPLQAKSFDGYGRHQLPIACDTDHLLTHTKCGGSLPTRPRQQHATNLHLEL